ncbi:MAG: methyltransferase domain-containing protein [Rhodocyclaceae bacterium]|nr:methyltransferase domain-containing protein [Rhodocyclaceae bacterium]MBX3669922.1 methyltransferase domain-containing protein [Rhodocyclaceae bacterium]
MTEFHGGDRAANCVAAHYATGNLIAALRQALQAAGKDPSRLVPADLAPVDEFHVRGREATLELASRARPEAGELVLDVGCGLGGSARHLAQVHGCRVCAVDLTQTYVAAAHTLAQWVGLDSVVHFQCASALALPYAPASFDLVWTEHVQMNIADKRAFYTELLRVLQPGGRLAFHDVFQGAGGAPHYPVPWAGHAGLSHLIAPAAARDLLESLGAELLDWEDRSEITLEWFRRIVDRQHQSGPPPLGLHILMGESAARKTENLMQSLAANCIRIVQAVVRKR